MVKGKTKTKKVVKGKGSEKLKWVPGAACTVCGVVTEKVEDCCSHLKSKFGLPLKKEEEKEKVCTVCGNIAKNESEYCDHQKKTTVTASVVDPKTGKKKELPGLSKALTEGLNQPELGGMPPKPEAAKVAEDILDLRDHIKGEREKMNMLKQKFASEMRLIQQSKLLVKGWEFDIDMVDKITIKKKK